jgi:hypothetical protein
MQANNIFETRFLSLRVSMLTVWFELQH